MRTNLWVFFNFGTLKSQSLADIYLLKVNNKNKFKVNNKTTERCQFLEKKLYISSRKLLPDPF